MAKTSIEWADYTFNPWAGCTKISPGCEHCYAAAMGKRFNVSWGDQAQRKIKTDQDFWQQPLKWNATAMNVGERRRVFALSMGDWLDDRVELIDPLTRLLEIIHLTPALNWLLLTKRPQLWETRMRSVTDHAIAAGYPIAHCWLHEPWPPLSNAWTLVSCENQEAAERRIPALLRIPSIIRGLSCEPLLGQIDLRPWLNAGISWVIAGGESGPGARPCEFEWLRSLRDQCREKNVPFFLKQLGNHPRGEWAYGKPPISGRHQNGRWKLRGSGAILADWPMDLRIREFPKL